MKIDVLTLFPHMFESVLGDSVIGRAQNAGLLDFSFVNIRDFSVDKHKRVDDYPYGAGGGLVMTCQPIYDAYQSLLKEGEAKPRVIYLSPQGSVFNQQKAISLSKLSHVVLLCGHYEGVDERVLEEIVDEEISVGDFVLTGGEIAAMAVIDATCRMIPGVLDSEETYQTESHYGGLLEYPQYTRPPVFMEKAVPEILLSGHHKNIETWRREQSLLRTLKKRPDMLKHADLTEKDIAFLKEREKLL